MECPTKDWSLAIEALPHGGYIVRTVRSQEMMTVATMLYASLELKDCLKFLEKKLYRPESR